MGLGIRCGTCCSKESEGVLIKILALADLHDNFEAFEPASLPEADLCIVAGDLTNYGVRGEWQISPSGLAFLANEHTAKSTSSLRQSSEITRARQWLRQLASRYPVLWIPGNHDIGIDNRTFADVPGCLGILDTTLSFGGLRLHGVSMCPCYDMPVLADQWDYMTANSDVETAAYAFEPVDIVVSHCPPLGYLDSGRFLSRQEPRHYGSRALRNYIDRNAPRLVICGHIHEGSGYARISKTEIVNVAGRWQVLEIGEA
jgi:Icc-related predicted phosphoesterase